MSPDMHRVRRELRMYNLGMRHFLTAPRENEVRVLERDGRRWLEQWRMPPDGQRHQRTWVEVAELPWPAPKLQRPAQAAEPRRASS